MEQSLYVALSGQVALERRLDSVARNVANAATAGYRAEGVRFATYVSSIAGRDSIAYSSAGDAFISRRAGALTETGNPLDVAVQGDAWMAVLTPSGPVYTRDGRMALLETGDLVSVTGHPVLDAGGQPLVLDPQGGAPAIARDGMITQNGQQLGAIGLFTIDERAGLARHEGSGVIPDRPAEPLLDFGDAGIVQGFVERSNVNPVLEMVRLIEIQRRFEATAAAISKTEATLGEAIRILGGR